MPSADPTPLPLASRSSTTATTGLSPFAKARQFLTNLFSPSWMSPQIYNTFRYGLVLLYLGTLFIVIGYHNPWVNFIRYVGLAMVGIGLVCAGSAIGQTCSRIARHHSVLLNYTPDQPNKRSRDP